MTSPQEDLNEALEALRALVSLKEGPRDAHYRENKGPAWQRARDIIEKIEAKEASLAQMEHRRQVVASQALRHQIKPMKKGEEPWPDGPRTRCVAVLGGTGSQCKKIVNHPGKHVF